jgi:hypothetical protein
MLLRDTAVRSRNKSIISVAAPRNHIQLDHTVAFWSSFYVKTFSRDAHGMHSDRIAELLRPSPRY